MSEKAFQLFMALMGVFAFCYGAACLLFIAWVALTIAGGA